MAHFVDSGDEELLEYGPCECGHTLGEHDDEGVCEHEDCDCVLYTEAEDDAA